MPPPLTKHQRYGRSKKGRERNARYQAKHGLLSPEEHRLQFNLQMGAAAQQVEALLSQHTEWSKEQAIEQVTGELRANGQPYLLDSPPELDADDLAVIGNTLSERIAARALCRGLEDERYYTEPIPARVRKYLKLDPLPTD